MITFRDDAWRLATRQKPRTISINGKQQSLYIPNGDGTFTTLEGEEAQKWYDKAGEEDQQEAAEEASTQSIEDVK